MLSEQLNSTKNRVLNELQTKDLADSFAKSLLNHIEPNSSMTAYCHVCKEVDKIDFVQFDANIMIHCCNCDIDIMNLETELYSFIHFNIQKKRAQKYE